MAQQSGITDYVQGACGKAEWVMTGRATTALYLLLKSLRAAGREVVLPVNVCYSLVHGVTLAGNVPRFVDVDPDHGNLRWEDVERTLEQEPLAVVVVHNLGNPCQDLGRIAEACRANDVLVIEDCAAAIGGRIAGQTLGTLGDFLLMSFGSGKTIDAALGGLVAASRSLAEVSRLNDQLPLYDDRLREKTDLFTQFYRLIVHSSFHDQLLERAAGFREFFEDMYLFRLRESERDRVVTAFERLPELLAERQAARACYDQRLPTRGALQPYPWADGAAPWRYNLLVDDPETKRRLIQALLDANVRVSTWYPPIHRLFGDGGTYPGAERFGRRILNLPLDQGIDQTRRIADVVCRVVGS